MKRNLLSIFFVLAVCVVHAQTGQSTMQINMSDKSSICISLGDKPSLTISKDSVKINTISHAFCKDYAKDLIASIDFILPDGYNGDDIIMINSTSYRVTSLKSISFIEQKDMKGLLPEVIAKDSAATLFSKALELTHMDDSLRVYLDMNYTCSPDSTEYGRSYYITTDMDYVIYPEYRYIAFTAFVETDEVFAKYGITNLQDLKNYAKMVYDQMYPEDKDISDPTDRRNSLNRFISYHLLPCRMTYDKLTVNDNILSNFDRKHWDVAEWYETLMPYSIMKISFPSGSARGQYINRRGVENHADERGVLIEGAKICSPSEAGTKPAINGVYHYIKDIIDYGHTTQKEVLDERLRIDATSLSPDFMTTTARGRFSNSTNNNVCFGFKNGSAQNFSFEDESTHLHVRNRHMYYWSYQGDAIALSGPFDVTVKLPPLPAGTYELRVLSTFGLQTSGVVQYYIDNEPCGAPVDLRMSGTDPGIGWRSDNSLGDQAAIDAYDKVLHNNGWMKGPASYLCGGSQRMRDIANIMRKIVGTIESDGKSDHYLRIKQVANNAYSLSTEFDCIELCPKTIYDNPDMPEDKW